MSYRRRSPTTSTCSSPATSTFTSSTWTARYGPPSRLLLRPATHSSSLTSHYSPLATHHSLLTTSQVWDSVDTSRIDENLKDISTTPSLVVEPKMDAHVFCKAVRQHAQTTVSGSGRLTAYGSWRPRASTRRSQAFWAPEPSHGHTGPAVHSWRASRRHRPNP